MRNLLLVVVTMFSIQLWAHESADQPAEKKSCDKVLTESDEMALQARAISTLIPMADMRGYIEELSGVRPLASGYQLKLRRTPGERAVARMLIKDHVERMGYKVKVEDFGNGANLVVDVPGRSLDHEVIEVSAHYDSVLTGADDNGSGVALLLGVLDLLRKTQHERHLRVVFMDLEEQRFQGSEFHTRAIAEENKTVGAIVVDTIGWAHPESKSFLGVLEIGTRYWSSSDVYSRRESFARELVYSVQRGGAVDGLSVSPEFDNAKPGTSDLGMYWRRDLPAVLFAAAYEDGFVNPHYHKIGDTLPNMNWDYYQRMSQAAVQMIAYASRMRLTKDNVISERGWEVLREQENRSVSLADFKLPHPTDRDVVLDSEHRRYSYSFDKDSDDDRDDDHDSASNYDSYESYGGYGGAYTTSPSVSQANPRSMNFQSRPNVQSAKKKSENYDQFPLYVPRFIEAIEETKGSDLFMFILPVRVDISGSKTTADKQGFIVAKNERVLDLVRDSDQVYDIMKAKVQERGGKVYTVLPTKEIELDTIRPEQFWSEIKDRIGRYTTSHTKFTLPEIRSFNFAEAQFELAPESLKSSKAVTSIRKKRAASKKAGKKENGAEKVLPEFTTIEQYKDDDVLMFIFENKVKNGHGKLLNSAFLIAGVNCFNLVGRSDDDYDLLRAKVWERGGKVYQVKAEKNKEFFAFGELWPIIKKNLSEAEDRNKFSVGQTWTTWTGKLDINLVPRPETSSASEKPKTKSRRKSKKAEAPQQQMNSDDSIWKD